MADELAQAAEALAEAAFRTGDFTIAERLYGEALAAAGNDTSAQARAVGGQGMMRHYRNITGLMAGRAVAEADILAEEAVMRRWLDLWQQTGDAAGTAMGMFGVGLVFQVLRRNWAAAMPYFWQAFGLAEAVEESADLRGCSEIHRHIGFYYLVEDARPREAVRRLTYSLALRERLGDERLIPSALVALGEAELDAANPRRAVGLLRRAATVARQAGLHPARIKDAEDALREAEAALPA